MAPLAPLLRPSGQKLWKPGQIKPQGTCEINWKHPLARGLISYWFNRGHIYCDLVTGATTIIGATARTVYPVSIPTPYGGGGQFNANNQGQFSPANTPIQNWTFPYSMASGFWQIGAGSAANAGPFSVADASGNDPIAIYMPTTTTLGISFGNAAAASNFTFANNTFYVVVGSATATTTGLVWVNGIAQTNFTSAVAYSGTNLRYCIGATEFDGAGSTNPNSIVFFGAVWTRALNVEEATQLYLDPYCFLMPVEPEMMIIQAAAIEAQEEVNWTIYRHRRRAWGY